MFGNCPAARDEFVYIFQRNLLNKDNPESGYYSVGAVRVGKYKISNINQVPVNFKLI